MQAEEYAARHVPPVEEALTRAVSDLMTEQPEDPLTFLAHSLLAQVKGSKSSGVAESPRARPEASTSGKWTAQAWITSLGIAPPIISALLDGDTSDELLAMRSLVAKLGSPTALAEHLRAGRVETNLAERLYPALVELAQVGPADEGHLQSKFAGAIEMSYAGLNTFYGGLEGRIGEPQAAVFETMRSEHQKRVDSLAEFTTGNYGVTTTSALEWLFVVEPSEVQAPI